VRWPWTRRDEPVDLNRSIADPTLAALFTPGGTLDLSGIPVGEASVLGLSAMFRAVSLISGTLASLPMPTHRGKDDGTVETVASVFDDPDGPDGQTVFEWKETMIANAVIHGRAYAMILRNEAGAVAKLAAVHPISVMTEEPTIDEIRNGNVPVGGLWHTVALSDGTRQKMDARDMFYVPALSTDGLYPWGLLTAARSSFRTSIAADRAAGNMFVNGAMISGLATPEGEEDITEDVPEIKRQLNRNTGGPDNAGMIAIVNRRLKFTPWTMTAVDAQFMQSRSYQIEETSRWTGVPPHLLMATEKTTSWGTGIEEQQRAMGRTVLAPWAIRFEHRMSRLLARPRYVRFAFDQLERPSPQVEQNMLINRVNAGIITPNEARAKLNMEPIEGGDVLRNGATQQPPQEAQNAA